MSDQTNTDDFSNLRFKRDTMRFLDQLPIDDHVITESKNLNHAAELYRCGLVNIIEFDSGPHRGEIACNKTFRGILYLNYMNGINCERKQVNLQSWIAITISALSLAVSIAAIIISL